MTEPHQNGMDEASATPSKPAGHKELPAWRQKWLSVPGPVRKSVVLTIGLTLLAVGGVLVILPGPFTLPFVIAGIAILSSEFVWAARLMHHGKQAGLKAKYYLGKVPKVVIGALIAFVIAGIAASIYWVFT